MPKHTRAEATAANKAKKRITGFRVKALGAFKKAKSKTSKKAK